MYSTKVLFRLSKTVSVAAIGILGFLIVLGNISDYNSNYYFVEHVMKMDTTFPDSSIHYRSINNPFLFHAGYIIIIIMEALMTFCCIKGSFRMFKNLKKDTVAFHESKQWSVAGIILGVIIWFLGFEVVGGEWFAMWQSNTWNGLYSADRIVTFLTLTLILVQMKEE